MVHELLPPVRDAVPGDVGAICAFGAMHVRAHYSPLIGAEAAGSQVQRWWNEAYITQAVARGHVVVAVADPGEVVGVGQRGLHGPDHVIYKLYVHPDQRGRGIGPRLIEALIRQLPPGADRLLVEQLAGNARAAAFYEREGFVLDHRDGDASDPLSLVWWVRELGGH